MPVHKVMQVTMFAHDVLSRTQPEVEGIPQQNLRTRLFYFFRRHTFYRAVSAHGHEGRSFNNTTFED